ncbi:hypothetical protein AArcSl_1793 [Halalkaliarchaeum desulfuricum]|uniref:CARDB domain-containing protein n=1 Tax=Halalkaliarchaeum desulfuricum TaxID=2055893 RepID=A0A343TJZ8_9EURY|nr:CARDB domain-containing protein [Halalkaliarchaeum desulfuricum]AUX09420.1 hypothetical protein AArcSl_1793 [Halalkaliarchaeum desulfuricum]
MRRLVPGVLLALLVVTGVAVVASGVPDARLVVSDAEPQQETITTDAPATVAVTVDLDAGSTTAITLDRVAIENETGAELGSATDLGSFSQGNSLTVPVTVQFDESGHHELQVIAEATDESDREVTATRPLSVVVEGAGPLVDIEPVESTVGTETTLELAVRNPSADQLRNLTVAVEGDGTDVRTDGRTIASLAPGETVERSFEVVPETSGEHSLEVTVDYATADGSAASVERVTTYSAVDAVADLGVRVTRIDDRPDGIDQPDGDVGIPGGIEGILGGTAGIEEDSEETESRDAIGVRVTNFGNAPAERIVVTPRIDNETLPRRSIDGPLEPGASGFVPIDLRGIESGEVTFHVTYETAGVTASTAVEYDHAIEAGDVTLTGADLDGIDTGGETDGFGETVRLSANLGNPTEQRVTGTIVRVVASDHVEPTYPQRDYFVGTLEPGEFAPFDVTAAVDGANATQVTLEVTFRSDGEVETRTFDLPYDDAAVSTDDGGSDRTVAVGVAIASIGVLIVAALAIVYRRRR